jgi:hypothetical protein
MDIIAPAAANVRTLKTADKEKAVVRCDQMRPFAKPVWTTSNDSAVLFSRMARLAELA